MPHLLRNLAEAEAEIERLRNAIIQDSHEIEQALGQALGYPRYADDQKNFPGATDADGVCVGEHVAVTMAEEAARRIEEQRQLIGSLLTANGLLRDRIDNQQEEVDRLRAANDDARGALSEWRTGRMADATGHRLTCAKIEGTWACDKGCAVAERDKLRVENVELQNDLDGYARQLEARKAEVAARDVLIGRLIEALRAFHDPFRHTPAYARTCATCRLLADPGLAPWRKP